MIIKKETLVFLTSLAIIFIIGYVNMTMSTESVFNEKDYATFENQMVTDAENIGDITDITDIINTADATGTTGADGTTGAPGTDVATGETKTADGAGDLNLSFETFKISKEKSNMNLVDHLEKNLTNEIISKETKDKFENILVTKSNNIKAESSIELMLQSKGYNETIAVVDENMVKVITNNTIEQADAVKILDVVVAETNYEPSQIKIVKYTDVDM